MTAEAFYRLPDSERDWWVARHQREASLHSCGHPHDVCGDPAKRWYPQRTVCYPTMEREAAAAKYGRLHSDRPWHDGAFGNWSGKPSDLTPYRYDMGVTVWVAQKDYSPDDAFLSGADVSQHVTHGEGGEGDG